MPAASLLALIDDIATLLDDVAVLSKVAAKKTAGVMGDDLALNANQVGGVKTERELPVVWAVAKGSFLNKLILVPLALVISAFVPKAILPLLMIGGIFLCYEGFEKIWHKFFHSSEDDAVEGAARKQRMNAMADPSIDAATLERDKIKGAIRTDFILSAEIVVISLGTMSTEPITQQIVSLSLLAIAFTVLVYGLVGAIVKLDDLGIRLRRNVKDGTRETVGQRFGALILLGAPLMMKALSILGTAAMFMVGGSIIAHAIPAIEHLIASWTGSSGAFKGVLTTVLDGLTGVLVGAATLAIVSGVKMLLPRKKAAAAH
jgi:uncharacterized protein